MESKPDNNKDTKDKEQDKDKDKSKAGTNDLAEEDNLFLNLIKSSLMNEPPQEGKNDNKNKQDKEQKGIKFFGTKNSLNNTENAFLTSSINKLQNGDDMDIMGELINLSEQLSLSSDQIGDNPNMPKLLEEICKNLEKLYLPEIIIYSLQCINYILDINPSLTSVLKRLNVIPKITMLISAMEDTSCLESIVSVFEKISYENSFLLLENNVFLSLLNVIDFLSIGQRKSILKTCQNISINTTTYKQFDLYIKPGLESLCFLSKLNEEDTWTTEKAINIYFNIITNLKQGCYFNNNPDLETQLSKYCFMENFCEILRKYFIDNDKKINAGLVKKILKIVFMLIDVSKKEMDKLLSLNFLNIIQEIIHHEFNDTINTTSISSSIIVNEKREIENNSSSNNINLAKSRATFLSEIFSLLIALFPNSPNKIIIKKESQEIKEKEKEKKEIKDLKILRNENRNYYIYLCKNIIMPLINNIMAKSACSTLSNLVKLILVFSKSASRENIICYINPKPMAQIISKLLDTKYDPYINDLVALIEIFMEKVPEHFIKNFIREGIVENIKNYKVKQNKPTKSSIKHKKSRKTSKNNAKSNDNKNNLEKKEKDDGGENKEKKADENDSFSDILDNEGGNYSDGFNENEDDISHDFEEEENVENATEENIKNVVKISLSSNKNDEKEKDSKKDDTSNNKDNNDKKDDKKEEKDIDETLLKETKLFQEIFKSFGGDDKEIQHSLLMRGNKQKIINEIFKRTKKLKSHEIELANQNQEILEKKLKELIEKYLTDEKIKSYLDKVNSVFELINLKETLLSLDKDLSEACSKNNNDLIKTILNKILNILTEPKNEITLFELENSGIIIGLCNFFEPIFKTQYNKLNIEDDNELQKNINLNELLPSPLVKNNSIYERMKLFLECLAQKKSKIINYIKVLEYSITSMNCFTMIVDDSQTNTNLIYYYNQTMRNVKKIELRVIYSESPYKENILNNNDIGDEPFKNKISEYNTALKAMKEVKFLLNEKSVFDDMSSVLLSNTNVPFVANEKYDVTLVYFLSLNGTNVKEKFPINEDWNIRELKKALLKKYGRTQGQSFFGVPIYFGLGYKLKDNTEKKVEKQTQEENNTEIKGFMEYFEPYNEEIKSFNNYIDFDKYSFIKDYHVSIIYSKSLYEIKRLMPSLFLLSLLHLSITKYRKLFSLEEDWFRNQQEWEEIFINSKVTLLISKASSDGNSVSKSSLPSWCKNLSIDCGFLTKFDSRQLSFKVSFDPRRSLINLQNYLKSIDPNYPNEQTITLEKSMRLKIIVDRNNILEHGFTLINDAVTSKFFGFLEFEYIGEIGNGLGPTLEFFSLVIEKISLNKKLWYNTTDKSLYPAIGLNEDKEAIKLFKLLGYIVGRAIYDDRLIDIPISRVFWNLLLERPVLYDDIGIIDKDLSKAMNGFKNLIIQKNKLKSENNSITDEEIENKVLYEGRKLSEAEIYFCFPGYDFELKPEGSNILLTMKNIEEYVNLVYDFLFYKGIDRVTTAFKDGFNLMYNIFNLKCFTSIELENYICGSLEISWDEETLYENLKPEHGYTKDCRIFKDLIKFMCSLDKKKQRQFLIFTTGTSRLPVGGFKALSPKLTVVKRAFDEKEFPDDFLPTVMTCQNYLKLPEYSSYEILAKKVLLAMNEGSKEFSLS